MNKPTSCPFLGLIEDPETHLAFPSVRNCCLRARPVEPVSLEHQSSHCLCMKYIHCVVLDYSLPAPLPEELRYSVRSKSRNVIGVIITAVLLVVLLVIVGWQSGVLARPAAPPSNPTVDVQREAGSFTPISPTTIKVAIPNLISDPRYTPTVIPTLTPTEIQSLLGTATPEEIPTIINTNTDTQFPIPTASVCSPPSGWVTYIVQPNDSLFSIGLDFYVSVTELQAANCLGTSVIIYAGERLFVPNIPTRTPQIIPTQVQTEAATATTQYETSTAKPTAPSSTDTPSPSETEIPTEIILPTETSKPIDTPLPSNTFTPPPIPTGTFTPPPTESGGG